MASTINYDAPMKADIVKWPSSLLVKKKRRRRYRTISNSNDDDKYHLDDINLNRNELLIWGKAKLSLDEYLTRRYAESSESIIPPHMRPSHMRLYAYETYIDMITKLQNDNVNNRSYYNGIGIMKVSEIIKKPLLHGEQITSIIDGVVRKVRFCAIELIDKYLRNSIKPLYTLCREAAILVEHIIHEIRKIVEEILLALINIYRSVGHLNLEKQLHLGEIESLSKLLTTVCEADAETEDEKSIKKQLDDDKQLENTGINTTTSTTTTTNNELVNELVDRFGISAEDVNAILTKYSYTGKKKSKRRTAKEKTFVTAVNELKKVNEGNDEDDDENDDENDDDDNNDDEESEGSDDSDESDENEHMSRVSESLVDESMHLQVNFEQTLLSLGEESQRYQVGLSNAITKSRLEKTEEARKTFLSGHKMLKDLNIESEEVLKLRKQVDQINRMHIATLEQQIKVMQAQLEKVKESILTPKEKEILRLKKMERELELHVQQWVTKHKDHHGRILRRNLLLYYLKYRFAKRRLIIAATRIQRMTRKGMVLLLLRKNMKRIYREMWADKVLKDSILRFGLYKRLKHKKARLLQKAMRRFVLRIKFKKILYASRKILMQRTAEIISSVVSQFDKRMKEMELFLVNCIPEDIVANVRVKVYGDYDEVKARKEKIDENHPFWKEMELIRQDIKQLKNRLIVTENKADTMKYAVNTALRAEKFNFEYDDFIVDDEFEQWQQKKAEVKRKKIEKMEEVIYEKVKKKKDKSGMMAKKRKETKLGNSFSSTDGGGNGVRSSVNSDKGKRRTSITSTENGNKDLIPNNLTAAHLQKLSSLIKKENESDSGGDDDDVSSVSSYESRSSVGSRESLSKSGSKSSIINKAIDIGKRKLSTSSLKGDKKKGKKGKKGKKKKSYFFDADDDEYPEANENFKAYDEMVKRGKWINKEKLLQRVENLNQFSVTLKKVYEENDMINFRETAISIKALELAMKDEEREEKEIAEDKRKRSFQGLSVEKKAIISDGESSLLRGMIRDPLSEKKGASSSSMRKNQIPGKSQLEILSEMLTKTDEKLIQFEELATRKVESTVNIDVDNQNDDNNKYSNLKFIQLSHYVYIDTNDLDNAHERKPRKDQWVNRIIEDSINQIFIMLTNLRLMPLVLAEEPSPISPLGMDFATKPMNEYELIVYFNLLNGSTPPNQQLSRYQLVNRKPITKPKKSVLLQESIRKGYNGVLSNLPEKLAIDDTNNSQEKRVMHLEEDMQVIDVVELALAGATEINSAEMLAKAIKLIRGIDSTNDVVLDLISASNFMDSTEHKNLNMSPLELLNNLTNSNGPSLIFSLYILKLCTIVENCSNQDKTLTNIPDKMNLSNAIKILQYIYCGIPLKKCKPAKVVIQTLDTYPIAFQQYILTLLNLVGITIPLNSSGVVMPLNSLKKISFVISDPLAMLDATAEVPETNVTVTYEENIKDNVKSTAPLLAHPPNKLKPSVDTSRMPPLRHVSTPNESEELSTIIRKNINDSVEAKDDSDSNIDMIFTENNNVGVSETLDEEASSSASKKGTHYMTLYAYRRYLQNKLYKEQMLELTKKQQMEDRILGDVNIDAKPVAIPEINNMIKANEFLDIAKLSPYKFVESFLEFHAKQCKSLKFSIRVNKYFRMADLNNAKILTRVDFIRIVQSINNIDLSDNIIKDYYAKSLIAFNTSSMDFKCFYYAIKLLVNDNIIQPII